MLRSTLRGERSESACRIRLRPWVDWGIKLDADRRPVEESLVKAAPELLLVEVELD